MVLDFAAFRGPDLESDLRDRDFTINAIALDLSQEGKLIDPLDGALDLRTHTLRACAATSFEADPVRILRAARIATAFKLKIAPDTLRLLHLAIPLLGQVSPERVRDEIFKILDGR
jgi:tRNA nucleotidyltransferase/poly(A) polymerase